MKPLQLIAVMISLVACLSLLSWFLGPQSNANVRSTPAKAPADGTEQEADDAKKGDAADEADKEHYKTNPFKPAKGNELPKLEVVEREFAFGRMALGATGEHEFLIRNVGTAPAKIARGPVQCKCTVTGLKDREIPPGGEARIHLEWTPKESGPFSQSATVWSNDPENLEIKLIVSGELFPELTLSPENGWSLGPISNSNDVPLTGMIESAVIDEFKITEIVKSSDQVELEAVPYTKEELEQRQVRSGYHLKGRLKGIEKPQSISERITLHTDLKNQPKFEFPVTATRTGSITIIGPNWYAGGPLLELGNVDAAKGKEVKLTVMIAPGEEELKLTGVSADPGYLTAILKPEQTGKQLARERYSLFVTVPPNSIKGIWTSAAPGKLVLKTNHPLVPELAIKIHLSVE